MAKVVDSGSAPIPPDPDQPQPTDGRKEVYFVPNPKTSAQRRINAKSLRVFAAVVRQEENAHAPPRKLSKGQKKARRKRTRDIHYKAAVQSALERCEISPERAKELLPKRQKHTKNDT
jgi:hypothetical protein